MIYAHGVGGRSDLPLELWMVAYGAAFALLISFAALVALWPRPRLLALSAGVALPSAIQRARPVLALVLRAAGLLVFGVTIAAAVIGGQRGDLTLAPYAVCVVFWVGIPMASAQVGDVFAAANPFDSLAALLRFPDRTSRPEPGLLPAAAMILSFAWLELAYHGGCGDERALAGWLVGYVAAILVGGRLWGRQWIRRAEGFAALFGLIALLAPLYWDPQARQLRLRMPLSGLASMQFRPGLSALVLVSLGSTTFDGFTRTQLWGDVIGQRVGWDRTVVNTVGLVWMIALVSGAWLGATHVTARVTGRPPQEIVAAFTHSLVPIVLGYLVAHYFSFLVFEGQNFIALASDPFARGWDLFGTFNNTVDYTVVSTRTIANVQVVGIVVGHVAGVVVAHDRSVELFEPQVATPSQYPLLAVMVVYTVGALLLLLGG